jgi:16S rRNA (cytidine1402-2'-O)-methyltransferase
MSQSHDASTPHAPIVLPAKLYLIPNTLGDVAIDRSLPPYVSSVVSSLRYFLVEDEKSARKFIKQVAPHLNIRELSIFPLNEHTKPHELPNLLAPLRDGHALGIISEAGCPAIADPGAEIVRLAHEANIPVEPLVGPCSMVLALMASGLNGQSWRFQGYLPIEDEKRRDAIRELEERARSQHETQIIMDTPYRNEKLFQELVKVCRPDTRLCIAAALTTDIESIKTKTIAQWRNAPVPTKKAPSLFLIGA